MNRIESKVRQKGGIQSVGITNKKPSKILGQFTRAFLHER